MTKQSAPLTVEVVLCSYNGSRYITEQLASITSQTWPVDRVSVYDDGSSDGTQALVRQFAATATISVVLVENPINLGYANNFAQALQKASADIVFFSDQDDIWLPTKVAAMAPLFKDASCVMAFSDGQLVDDKGILIEGPSVLSGHGLAPRDVERFETYAWDRLLRGNVINGAAMAVRRTAAVAGLPIPPEFPHDYWLALWLSRPGKIIGIPQVLYSYRLHQNNLIGTRRPPLRHRLYSMLKNPAAPRHQDLQRTRALVDRLPDDARLADSMEKLRWLGKVASESTPVFIRLAHIAISALCGKYRKFGTADAMLRDLATLGRRGL